MNTRHLFSENIQYLFPVKHFEAIWAQFLMFLAGSFLEGSLKMVCIKFGVN